MKGSVVAFLAAIVLFVSGLMIQDSTKAWTEQRTRAILVIDAYEHYDEYGNRSLKGIALDKKLQHEFVVSLSAQQFQKFQSTKQPLDNLEVKTSLYKMDYPGAPTGKITFGVLFASIGVMMALVSVVAFFVYFAKYREEKKRQLWRRNLERRYGY